jgi:two-component sensor histidine kinase
LFPKASILIVDDRPENLIAMNALLEGTVDSVVTAGSGNEALAAMLDHDFALVLLDVQMPEMDGFETAELMRANSRTRDIPIVFVTAVNREQKFVFRGYEAGAIDYVFKPIDPFILRSKVAVFLELYERRASLERALEANRILMREIHHRVKNNLAMVASLIGLEERCLKDEADIPVLEDLKGKIDAIVLVYDLIHKTGDVSSIDMRRYLGGLADGIMDSVERPVDPVRCLVESDEIRLSVNQGETIGLIVNELVTNAVKYAFPCVSGKAQVPSPRTGTISIALRAGEGRCVLSVSDDGAGFSPEGSDTDSFGMILVDSLARQLGGSFSRKEKTVGSRLEVEFPWSGDA